MCSCHQCVAFLYNPVYCMCCVLTYYCVLLAEHSTSTSLESAVLSHRHCCVRHRLSSFHLFFSSDCAICCFYSCYWIFHETLKHPRLSLRYLRFIFQIGPWPPVSWCLWQLIIYWVNCSLIIRINIDLCLHIALWELWWETYSHRQTYVLNFVGSDSQMNPQQ